eukprot:m.41482 g.41482  ORF g.41482 m.41482 type:complete len:648 (+) comp9771_c0_seq1:75-2018(+)
MMPTSSFFQKQPCRFYLQGMCKNGEHCPYSHEQYSQEQPPSLAYSSAVAPTPAQGTWAVHNSSPFHNHVMQKDVFEYAPYQEPQATMSMVPTKESSHVCSFFLKGKCRNGLACKFSHIGDSTPATVSPCTFFQLGKCTKGNSCRYAHVLVLKNDQEDAPQLITETLRVSNRVYKILKSKFQLLDPSNIFTVVERDGYVDIALRGSEQEVNSEKRSLQAAVSQFKTPCYFGEGCRRSNCTFVHDKKDIPTWHCKSKKDCWRKGCAFLHPEGHEICRFYKDCNILKCKLIHPPVCQSVVKGETCKVDDCEYLHKQDAHFETTLKQKQVQKLDNGDAARIRAQAEGLSVEAAVKLIEKEKQVAALEASLEEAKSSRKLVVYECFVDGTWLPYPTQIKDKFENAKENNDISTAFEYLSHNYTIDWAQSVQINQKTRVKRPIRRVERVVAHIAAADNELAWTVSPTVLADGVLRYRVVDTREEASRASDEYNKACHQFMKMMGQHRQLKVSHVDVYENQNTRRIFKETEQEFQQEGKGSLIWAFHGTSEENIETIMKEGFKVGGKEVKIANGKAYGTGVYTATGPDTPMAYGKATPGKVCGVILLKCLPGNKGPPEQRKSLDSWVPASKKDWLIFKHPRQLLPVYVVWFLFN